MRAWLTPRDRDGLRWRIELWPDGRARVFLLGDGSVASAPLRAVGDMRSLAEWLVVRDVDLDDLTPC